MASDIAEVCHKHKEKQLSDSVHLDHVQLVEVSHTIF